MESPERPLDERWHIGTECYAGKAVITVKPRRPEGKVYYTLQDPYFIWSPERPGPANPKARLYEAPIALSGGGAIFRARCFDAAGRPAGGEFVKWFQHVPVLIGVEGARTVVVSSPDVPSPVAVRYAYAINPEGANLYNREGLPASPFRTDGW